MLRGRKLVKGAHVQRQGGQSRFPVSPAPDLPVVPAHRLGARQEVPRPLLVASRGDTRPRVATTSQRGGAQRMVQLYDATCRHSDRPQKAGVEPDYGWSV